MSVLNAQTAIELAVTMKEIVQGLRHTVLRPGIDYGDVKGGNKPTLLKPGAERLCSAFKLTPSFRPTAATLVDFERGLFFYEYECILTHRETGEGWGTGIGSCNSRETKYGWRWVRADQIPPDLNPAALQMRRSSAFEFEFAIERAETSGKYGKPSEYWEGFRCAIEAGEARREVRRTSRGEAVGWVVETVEFRVPNPEIYDQVNTISKMAQKRALIAATLVATNASEFFTQDVEDMPGFDVVTVTPIEQPAVWYTPENVQALLDRCVRDGILPPQEELMLPLEQAALNRLDADDWSAFESGRAAYAALKENFESYQRSKK